MKNTLSKDMYWLPGYEDRYAIQMYTDNSVQVYSFVAPGSVGQPYPVCRNTSGKWQLTKRGSRWKTSFGDDEMIRFVKASPAYKKAQLEHMTHSAKPEVVPSTQLSTNCTRWVIGDLSGQMVSFSDSPKSHLSEKEAFAEAERLARKHPGTTFVVFRTVRTVVAGGVIVTNL